MPVEVHVVSNFPDLIRRLKDVGDRSAKKAASRSISRTLQGVVTQTTKAIRQEKLIDTRAIPVSVLKERYLRKTLRAGARLELSQMLAKLQFSDSRPSVRAFFARRVAVGRRGRRALYGVSVEIMRKRYTLGKAFWPNTGGRPWPVLARTGKGRYPLRKLYGPSLAILVQRMGTAKRLQEYAGERLRREMEQNLSYYLKQPGAT